MGCGLAPWLATGRFGAGGLSHSRHRCPPATKHRLVVGQPILSGPPCAAPSEEAVLELYMAAGAQRAALALRGARAHDHEVLPKAVEPEL